MLLCAAALLALPGYRAGVEDREFSAVEVVAVDNSDVMSFGVVRQGEQMLTVESPDRNGTIEIGNTLLGDPELDWCFKPGEKALISHASDQSAELLGPCRLKTQFWLAALFIVVLVAVAGKTGLKALLSFAIAVLAIWKVLLPMCLAGWNPIATALPTVLALTAVITILIGGLSRRGFTAWLGSSLGVTATCATAAFFAPGFHLTGLERPFAKAVMFGHANLNLYQFFIAGIFIASSGAVMDLAMDVATAMDEVKRHHQEITRKKLFLSGMRVGRAVIGTMTTTLLLAYSGGYLFMLMYFMSIGMSLPAILNSTYISGEILNTLVGSFGLVTVAPFTALAGALVMAAPRNETP